MKFHCIDDAVPEATIRLLRQACARRSVEFVHVHAPTFGYDESSRPQSGDMLYRPAVSIEAQRVEQWMIGPGIGTFYRDPQGAFFQATNPGMLLAAAGLPVPRTFYCRPHARDLLAAQVEDCGGFPVVVKVLGFSRGIGVMRADSMEALVSLVDFAFASGRSPILMPFVAPAVHWRVVVVGSRAVVAYRNPVDAHDFRTYGSTDAADFTEAVPRDMASLAMRAVETQRLELGGVDILEHASGRLYLLESNFPLYHAHAEEVSGCDVSGAMVEHLAAKAGHTLPDFRMPPRVDRLADTPAIHSTQDFASTEEIHTVLELLDNPRWRAVNGVAIARDAAGEAGELPVAGHPLLAALAQRMRDAVGLPNHLADTLRFRRYAVGDSHPPHGDFYEIRGLRLVATALLYLTDAEGGETFFPAAQPQAVRIAPRAGQLAWWHNHRPDGSADPAALHEALPVSGGSKAVLGQFFYAPLSALGGASPSSAARPR